MSEGRSRDEEPEALRSASGRGKSRFALYRRRMKLYKLHRKLNPSDVLFQNLSIGNKLYKRRSPRTALEDTSDADAEPSRPALRGYERQCTENENSVLSADEINDNAVSFDMDVSDFVDGIDDNELNVSSTDDKFDESDNDNVNNTPNKIFSLGGVGNLLPTIMTMRENITEDHVLSLIIAASVRHRLTYEATVSIFELINSITSASGLPHSMKDLWVMLMRNDELAMVRHLYCHICKDYVGEGQTPDWECTCTACGPRKDGLVSYFIAMKLAPQLRQLFATSGIIDSLRYRFERTKKNVDAMEDIYDSKEYKKKCEPGGFLSYEHNFSFILNTDGCQVTKSSKTSAWPILLEINELPPHARKRHMLLGGVWVDEQHPVLETILLPIATELNELYNQGITWSPNGIDQITSKFITLMCTVDSMARAPLLNMTLFNGMYGCTFCYAKGFQMPGRGVRRVYPAEKDIKCRTDMEMRQQMEQAFDQDKKIYGVKGLSVLKTLPEFDLSRGVVVDSMHQLFLGVSKQHTLILLCGKVNESWYAGRPIQIASINKRLMKIQPPHRISRKPRPITTLKQWKASEWRNWLLYYSIPCMQGIISPRDLQLFILLSRVAYILNKDSISKEELREARLLLTKYVKGFESRYGRQHITYNVHLLTHLVDTVENWGPLWVHSAFPFESWNKKIIDSVTSANSRPLQIATRFLMSRFIEDVMHDIETPWTTRRSIHSILHAGKKKKLLSTDVLTGGALQFHCLQNFSNLAPSAWRSEVLGIAGFRPEILSFFKRAVIKRIEYRCRGHNEETRFCDKFIYCKSIGFGEILSIVRFRHNGEIVNGLFVNRMRSLGIAFGARHIENVIHTSERVFVLFDDIEGPVLTITILSNLYAIRLSNVWETD